MLARSSPGLSPCEYRLPAYYVTNFTYSEGLLAPFSGKNVELFRKQTDSGGRMRYPTAPAAKTALGHEKKQTR